MENERQNTSVDNSEQKRHTKEIANNSISDLEEVDIPKIMQVPSMNDHGQNKRKQDVIPRNVEATKVSHDKHCEETLTKQPINVTAHEAKMEFKLKLMLKTQKFIPGEVLGSQLLHENVEKCPWKNESISKGLYTAENDIKTRIFIEKFD